MKVIHVLVSYRDHKDRVDAVELEYQDIGIKSAAKRAMREYPSWTHMDLSFTREDQNA